MRLTRRRALALGFGGTLLPSPFIGGMAMPENTPDTVVYVSNAGSKEIYILAMNRDSGDLSMLDKVPVPGTDKPSPASTPMAVSPDHRFLYAAQRHLPGVEFCDRRCERAADPSRDNAAAGQHGLYHHRPHWPVSAQRLLSRQ